MKINLEEFTRQVLTYITGGDNEKLCTLVKKHTENFNSVGDFSFPNSYKSWGECFRHIPNYQSLNCITEENQEKFIIASQDFDLVIKKINLCKDRVHVYLDRPKTILCGLLEAISNFKNITGKLNIQRSRTICDPLCLDNSITSLRVKSVSEVVDKLYSIIHSSDNDIKIFVTSKSTSKGPAKCRRIFCSTVLNIKTGLKEGNITEDEFIRIRQEEMTLISQHKYGVRVTTDSRWKEFIDNLGESAVTFELLQTKPSNCVKINFECSSAGSSKGAAFVLYNCARLETLLRSYEEHVQQGTYPPLPDIIDVDFNLLTQEDEWNLLFNYVMGLPTVLKNSLEITESSCECRPHHLCSFLSNMVKTFSQYYRRVRILTEPRKHLLPVMFSRLHLIRALRDVLTLCLRVLNIKAVTQM